MPLQPSLSLRSLPLACLFSLASLALDGQLTLANTAKPNPNPRALFPGRRIGGGTRGECNSRLIVHLVPESSVFAPGDTALLGLLEGPASEPHPLQLTFRPQAGTAPRAQRLLTAGPPALVLLNGPPLSGPTLWESNYRCGEGAPSAADPLQVVTTSSPPALSLLVQEPIPQDAGLRERLQALKRRCGGTVSRTELGAAFALADLLQDGWPDQLPVRCPS